MKIDEKLSASARLRYLIPPTTRGSAPGPLPQTSVIGSRSTRSPWSEPLWQILDPPQSRRHHSLADHRDAGTTDPQLLTSTSPLIGRSTEMRGTTDSKLLIPPSPLSGGSTDMWGTHWPPTTHPNLTTVADPLRCGDYHWAPTTHPIVTSQWRIHGDVGDYWPPTTYHSPKPMKIRTS